MENNSESSMSFEASLVAKNGFYLIDIHANSLDECKSFNVKSDDVLIASFPKSGTTWVQEIVYLIRNGCDFEKAGSSKIEERIPYLEDYFGGVEAIGKIESPRTLKTHLPFSFLPNNVENKCKVVYVFRNPKDVAVSLYYFVKLNKVFDKDFDSFLDLFLQGKVWYGPWWSHLNECVGREGLFLISYEDLHNDPTKEIKRLAKFLDKELTSDEVGKLIDWCSFDHMKLNPMTNYENYKEMGLFSQEGSFMRKGKIGDWKSHFTQAQSDLLDDLLTKNLHFEQKFHYEPFNQKTESSI